MTEGSKRETRYIPTGYTVRILRIEVDGRTWGAVRFSPQVAWDKPGYGCAFAVCKGEANDTGVVARFETLEELEAAVELKLASDPAKLLKDYNEGDSRHTPWPSVRTDAETGVRRPLEAEEELLNQWRPLSEMRNDAAEVSLFDGEIADDRPNDVAMGIQKAYRHLTGRDIDEDYKKRIAAVKEHGAELAAGVKLQEGGAA